VSCLADVWIHIPTDDVQTCFSARGLRRTARTAWTIGKRLPWTGIEIPLRGEDSEERERDSSSSAEGKRGRGGKK
jgi:hypothetical protein